MRNMREFDYVKLKSKLWDSEILSYVAQIHEYKGRQELYIWQLCKDKTAPRNQDEREIMGYRDVLNTIHEGHDYIPIRHSYIL